MEGSAQERNRPGWSDDARLHQLPQTLQPLTTTLALRADANQIRYRLAIYTLAATNARAPANAVRRIPVPAPALADACRALARAAQALADRQNPDRPLTAVDTHRQQVQEFLDNATETCAIAHRQDHE